MFFRLVTSVGQRKILSPHEESNLRPSDPRSEGLGSTPHGDSEFFLCPTLGIKRKNFFPYFFTELKTYHLSYFYLQRLNYVRHHSVLGQRFHIHHGNGN